MKYKIILLFFLTSCANSTYMSKNNFTHSAKGFAFIESILPSTITENEFYISHNKLKKGTKIRITNPENEEFIVAVINKKINYDNFYKVLISESIAKKLNLNVNFPYVEINEIKTNKSFIAKKAITENIEKKIANKAPVEKINIDNLSKNKKVLEVGVGLGTDILQFAKGGALAHGIDLTNKAIELTSLRFAQNGLKGIFKTASFTQIPFEDDSFDLIYSFGVLHHSEETQEGIDEIFRVLSPGGEITIMLYHKGFKYYIRKLFLYGVLKGEYFRYTSQEIINRHSEDYGLCPMTKAYNRPEAAKMFSKFTNVTFSVYRLDDYITLKGKFISLSKLLLPSRVYRAVENKFGWNLIIKAKKPAVN